MKEKMYHTSIRTTKPLCSLQLKYIPPGIENNMRHDCSTEASCRHCQTIHDDTIQLNPNAKEFIPQAQLNPNATEFIPQARWQAGIENIAPFKSASPRAWSARSLSSPAQRPAPCLPGGPAPAAGPAYTAQSAGQRVGGLSGAARLTKTAKVGPEPVRRAVADPEVRAAAGDTAGTAESARRPADTPPQPDSERLSQKHVSATVQNGAALSAYCDSFIVSPTSEEVTDLCHKSDSGRVSPDSGVSCTSTGLDSVHNVSDISKRTQSPSQCSDSTKPRRASLRDSRDSRANNPSVQSARSPPAAAAVPCPSSTSTSQREATAAGVRCRLPPSISAVSISTESSVSISTESSVSISAESSDDSSDESSDDDSTLGDDWDAASVTFQPGSSVDSADDFILFVGEEECCPTEAAGAVGAATPAAPQTPVFGPACADQVDSGLSAEMTPSESGAEDWTEDELDEDECDLCQSAPAGTCMTHERIAEANRQLHHWCGTPPPACITPRTCKVRFLSGEGLATVHAAPDYDRAIASDLLDQQRQRDRLDRWRQEVERDVAPLLAAVLDPAHRQRVLRERPELLPTS